MYAVLLLIIRLIAINLVVSKWWPIDFDSHLHLNRFHTITAESNNHVCRLKLKQIRWRSISYFNNGQFLDNLRSQVFLHLSKSYYKKGWTYCLSLCKQKQYNTKCIQLIQWKSASITLAA